MLCAKSAGMLAPSRVSGIGHRGSRCSTSVGRLSSRERFPEAGVAAGEQEGSSAVVFRGTVVDVQARGPSLGDQEVTSGAVLDSNGHKIGHFANICTLVEAGRNPLAQCITTGRLSSGQVTLQGLTRLAAANATCGKTASPIANA